MRQYHGCLDDVSIVCFLASAASSGKIASLGAKRYGITPIGLHTFSLDRPLCAGLLIDLNEMAPAGALDPVGKTVGGEVQDGGGFVVGQLAVVALELLFVLARVLSPFSLISLP
jgi:hypothetical protein